jgi:flagellar hook-associated protein FlgK
MQGFSISATGMMNATLRMSAVAHNVANANVEPPVALNEVESEAMPQGMGVISQLQTRESVLGTEMVSEVLNLKLASLSFAASAKVAIATNSTLGTLINMLDTDNRAR